MKVIDVRRILFLSLGMGLVGGSVMPIIIAIMGDEQSLTIATVVLCVGLSFVLSSALQLFAAARIREEKVVDLLKQNGKRFKPEDA